MLRIIISLFFALLKL